jgi:hypothetical protein
MTTAKSISKSPRQTVLAELRAQSQPGVDGGVFTPDTYNEHITAASSFSLTLDSGTRNAIQWIAVKDRVLVGTTGGEWSVSGIGASAITPFQYDVKNQTVWGSKDMQPLVFHGNVLFADRVGKKLRAMTSIPNATEPQYVSPDLLLLAEHITSGGGITTMAYQRNPDSLLWCTLSNGDLVSCTLDQDQNVTAWAVHPVGGTDAEAESVAVIPGSSEDEVWVSVARTIGGTTKRYIERKNPQDWGDDQEDCFFVDSGVTYDSTATDTITGLDHLNGETVAVLGDGGVFATQVVQGGSITLAESVSVAQVGLPYTFTVKPMRADQGFGGTSKGRLKIIGKVTISFYKTLNAKYSDGTNVRNIDFRTTEPYTTPPVLFTGDKKVVADAGFSVEDPFQIEGSDPLPCSVRAIVYKLEVTED